MEKLLRKIRSKSIAIVYAYKNERAEGFDHYDYWAMNVVTDWAKAIEEISCIPYIIDVRTFGYKALNNSLPPIDFVINLNAGNSNISTLGLVPSICGFLSIPCIPCDTLQAVAGEHKELSNLVAQSMEINVPRNIDNNNNLGIFRPMNLGSSKGVRRGEVGAEPGIYQEFINGFDMTTPILYNPISKNLETLPPISYIPTNNNLSWFLGEKEKESHEGYKKKPVRIDSFTQNLYIKLAKAYGVKTFCRIDTRIKCRSKKEMDELIKHPIRNERVFFLEINTMPTITEKINFCNSVESITSKSSFYKSLSGYNRIISNPSIVGFILFCSIAALIGS